MQGDWSTTKAPRTPSPASATASRPPTTTARHSPLPTTAHPYPPRHTTTRHRPPPAPPPSIRPKRGAGVTAAARRKKAWEPMARSDSSGQGQTVLRRESTAETCSGRRERPEDAMLERTDILKEGSEREERKTALGPTRLFGHVERSIFSQFLRSFCPPFTFPEGNARLTSRI